jgi:hypothetical protein
VLRIALPPRRLRPARAGAIHELSSPLKCDPQTSSGAPNHPATLPGPAEQQFKSTGQLGLPPDLKACTARRIIHNSAINNGGFRANDQFGRAGIPASRSNASKPSRVHHAPPSCAKIQRTVSQNILKVSLCFMVTKIHIVCCHTDRVRKSAFNARGRGRSATNSQVGACPVPDKGRLQITSILDVSFSVANFS